MTDFNAAQGYVNCGNTQVVTDIESVRGLPEAIDRASSMAGMNGEKSSSYTDDERFQIFVRMAVQKLAEDTPLQPGPGQLALF